MFVKNTILPKGTDLLADVYFKHKDEDGFLRFDWLHENTFGGSFLTSVEA